MSREIKKNVDVVSDEVKFVQKSLQMASEVKAKENNVIIFNLIENEDVAKDNEVVMNTLTTITDSVIKQNDVSCVFR